MINNIDINYLYEKNLLFFKYHAPELYKRIKGPFNNIELIEKKVGIVNFIYNGKLLYNQAPEIFCKIQVNNFINSPYEIIYPFTKYSEQFLSLRYINKIHDLSPVKDTIKDFREYYKIRRKISLLNRKDIPLLIVFGVGVGYHIQDLVETLNIKNLVIVEPEVELIYTSLFTMDWDKINKKLSRLRGKYKIILSKKPEDIVIGISSINPVFINHAVLYFHFERDREILKAFIEKIDLCKSGIGFYEDEKISLKHTIENINSNIPVFNKKDNNKIDIPVFIIGAGPSLDKSIEVIKRYKNKAILFSCGSALHTLEKENLVPDFHIEIERTKQQTYESLKVLNSNYLKQIDIIGNNTIPIEAFNLFKNKYMFLKYGDTGSSLFNDDYIKLSGAYPSVVNGAISLALHLGFKNIYLFGVDLGFKDPKYHHSKYNLSMDKNSNFYIEKMYYYKELDGNFGDKFYVNGFLLSTKHYLENILPGYEDIKVYNCSDGVKIEHTIPLKGDSLNLEDRDKAKYIEIIKRYFSTDYLNNIDINNKIKELCENTERQVKNLFDLLSKEINNKLDVIDIFYDLYHKIKKNILMESTILLLEDMILRHLFIIEDRNQEIEFINKSFELIKEFLNIVLIELNEIKLNHNFNLEFE